MNKHTLLVIATILITACSPRVQHDESSASKVRSDNKLEVALYNIFTGQNPLKANEVYFTDDYMRGRKAYIERTGDTDFLKHDGENIPHLKRQRSSYFQDYAGHSIRYGSNIFCATINPATRSFENLNDIITKWRLHAISEKSNFPTFFIKYGIREKDDYCWIAALQFIYRYQHGIHVEQSKMFLKTKKRDAEVSSGTFLDIIRAFGDDAATWDMAVQSEDLPIATLQDDQIPLFAINQGKGKDGHIVLVLGATYSFGTHAFWVNYQVSRFIYHKLLIFDPADGSIAEYDADDIIPRIDFVGANTRYRISTPLQPLDLRKDSDRAKFFATHYR